MVSGDSATEPGGECGSGHLVWWMAVSWKEKKTGIIFGSYESKNKRKSNIVLHRILGEGGECLQSGREENFASLGREENTVILERENIKYRHPGEGEYHQPGEGGEYRQPGEGEYRQPGVRREYHQPGEVYCQRYQ